MPEPGSNQTLSLPETPEAIEEEMRKQESLLQDLHLQISAGEASKKTEEQVWEQQRIITQLKVRRSTYIVHNHNAHKIYL